MISEVYVFIFDVPTLLKAKLLDHVCAICRSGGGGQHTKSSITTVRYGLTRTGVSACLFRHQLNEYELQLVITHCPIIRVAFIIRIFGFNQDLLDSHAFPVLSGFMALQTR